MRSATGWSASSGSSLPMRPSAVLANGANILPFALLLAGLVCPPAAAADDGNRWLGVAGFVCLAQDDRYAHTPLGEAITRDGAYQQWAATLGDSAVACLSARQLLPAALCSDIFKLDPAGKPSSVNGLYQRYEESIQGLSRIGECAPQQPS